jgi:hypothetical protein
MSDLFIEHHPNPLVKLCHIKEQGIMLNYIHFKQTASPETYPHILSHIVCTIDGALLNNETFTIHINMKYLTVADIDKHSNFIRVVSNVFKEKYPNKLFKCYIHNAPFMFNQIYKMISHFIDAETTQKIQVI